MKFKVFILVAAVTLVLSFSFTFKKTETKHNTKSQNSSAQRGFLSEDRL